MRQSHQVGRAQLSLRWPVVEIAPASRGSDFLPRLRDPITNLKSDVLPRATLTAPAYQTNCKGKQLRSSQQQDYHMQFLFTGFYNTPRSRPVFILKSSWKYSWPLSGVVSLQCTQKHESLTRVLGDKNEIRNLESK